MNKPWTTKAAAEVTHTGAIAMRTVSSSPQARAEFALELLQADPLARTLTIEQLRQLRNVLREIQEQAEQLTEQINALGEIPPGTFFGLLLARLAVGTGHFRDARFTIEAFFHARARGVPLSDLNSHIIEPQPDSNHAS